ncbi:MULTISPECIES: thiol-disulfide oxidoreductase DCC family protein [Bacillus]|uniref:thiol-disulfide oxidoreductase DCC family protein n=1 Tax=Bacillus TaxID=1386 RepID=UPI001E4D039F|nr:MULTISPECIES: DCC1-like thiol-disulfide oxidoreductase family protein [Bacillus]
MMHHKHAVILFDGECNFCSKSVQFIIARDRKEYFLFASLQSEIGQNLLKTYLLPTDCNSFVLIENNQAYTESLAAIRVCRHLDGWWKVFVIGIVIPAPIRNFFYKTLAKYRYKWWGQSSSCMFPTNDLKRRFLS